MNFIHYTLEWYKGEAFEASLTAYFGILLIVLALVCWIIGSTPGTQAMLIPLLVIGGIIGGSGIVNTYNNQQAIKQLESFEPDHISQFVQAEKERVEGFQSLYTFTKFLALTLFTIAILIFFFWNNKNAQATAIAMTIMGLSGLVIDFFSKERADTYYEHIILYLS